MGQLEHAQHTELIASMRARGCCAAAHLHVILISVAGTIYIPLKRLGLDHHHATQLARRMNAHSCAYARKLADTRYALVAATQHQRTQCNHASTTSFHDGHGVGGCASASEREVPGLLFLLPASQVGSELCACWLYLFFFLTDACRAIRDGSNS